MTSGLDDGVENSYCTTDSCLLYLADAGTRWAYHNAPYTLLKNVVENSTGQGINAYAYQKVVNPIGMNGLFVYEGYNSIFFSTARSMARFGLLMLNEGKWNDNEILGDDAYFSAMTNTSQDLNESYGYLWWLNGKNSFMVPQSQYVFEGSLCSNAPDDMYAAMGKNGQYINVVPSQNMVWIRMGDVSEEGLVPFNQNNGIWNYINQLVCDQTTVGIHSTKDQKIIGITDVLGRPSKVIKNKTLFYLYEDGGVEKKIILD
jgi:CubicO group peptidase (beta-lactamase class C family)